jgi:hypothetical protein
MVNIGDKIGRWEVIGKTVKNMRTYYTCRCECGTVKDVYYRSLEQGTSLSCGCLRVEMIHDRAEDLVGRRFGKLKVISRDENRHGYWICECDCGNRKSIIGTSLTGKKNHTISCGCVQREGAVLTGTKTVAKNSEKQIATNMAYHTNFQVIERKTPGKNNTSGHKGISWDESRKKWSVYIQVHSKRIYLGRYPEFEDAVEARVKAEEMYFKPLIDAKREEANGNG